MLCATTPVTVEHRLNVVQTPHEYIIPRSAPTSFGSRLHSFSIGLANSPDLEAGRKAAEFIGTAHHEFTFTIQEGLDAVSDVIYHLETYDVTTVRASTPMYLLSRKIKGLGIKMVLSGEGSDEVFGGKRERIPSGGAFVV